MNTGGTTRRALLAAGLGATLAGCEDPAPPPPPPPDPLRPVLDEALALAAAYDRAALAQPALAARLTPLAADHRAHAAELTRTMGPTAPASAGPAGSAGTSPAAAGTESSPGGALAELRAAEQAAQKTAVAACRRAPAARAALAGSIAACRATHAEALR